MMFVIDNAFFQKAAKIKNLVASQGIQLVYLPPYFPDLNPIEHYGHKTKTSIRKLMRNSTLLLENAMQRSLEKLSTV